MSKIISSLLVLLVIGGGAWYFLAPSTPSGEPHMEIPETADISQKAVVPEGWTSYENAEYGFSLAYPPEWGMQEALKPRAPRALHDIYFHEKEYDVWRAEFTVRLFPNENDLVIDEWWSEWLAEEDAKETECRAEHGDESPCLFLRGLVEREERTQLAGEEAIAVTLFRFDHEEKCIYAARGEYVYGLCYAGNNPNDPDAAAHDAITAAMHEQFAFIPSGQ